MTTQFQIAGKCKYCESVWDEEGVPHKWYCTTAPDEGRCMFADEPCDGTLTARCPWRMDDGYAITDNTPSRFDQPEEW